MLPKTSKTSVKSVLARSLSVAALAGAMLTAPETAKASLMAYEGFNYTSGSGLTGQAGGFGWNGAWQSVNNGDSSIQSVGLAAGANSPSGYDAYSTGKSVLSPNNTRRGRFLDVTAGGSFGTHGYLSGNSIGATGKTVYISFMQQPNGTTSYYELEFHKNDLGDGGRRGGVGNDSGGNTGVYLRVPSAGQTLIGPGSTAVNFYVVRIDFLGGNDTVYVYQNPTSVTDPGTGAATLTMPSAGDMSFNGISFGCFNNGRTVAHDEIRVGETWADVVTPAVSSAGNWDGGGSDNNWSTGGNWDNDVVPIFASSLTFAGSTRLNNTNDLTGVSANNITFDSAAGAFTLNGNSLGVDAFSTIGFSAAPSSPVTQTINLPLATAGDITVGTRTNGSITINGNITGGNQLTQAGPDNAGTLTLAGNNALKGLVINNGTNRITGNTTVTGIGGSSFIYWPDSGTARNSTVIIENSANLTITGAFQDSAVIARDGSIGKVIQNGGTFNFNITSASQKYLFIGATGNSNTRAEYNMNGGLLDMNGCTLGVCLSGAASVTGVVNQVSGVITNVGNLRFHPFQTAGVGIYNLTGGSLYIGSGGITVDGGNYQMNLGGGTVSAVASWSSPINMSLTGTGGPVTFDPNGNTITLSGVLSGTGGLTVNGTGVLDLSGANTFTGDTLVTSGSTLQIDTTGARAGAIKLTSGSTLNLNYAGTYAVSSLYLNGVLQPAGTYNAGNTPGYIVGSGDLVVSSISSGIWDGGGANNFWSTGGNWDNDVAPIFPHAVMFAGSTRLGNTNDLSGITISTLTFSNNAGAFTLGGNAVTVSGGIGFSSNPSSPVTQTANFDITFTGNQNINLPSNGNLTLNGSITSGFDLVKSGLGTLTLGGASDAFDLLSVTGGTNVITGNVTITGGGNPSRFYVGDIGTTGNLVIQPGASFNVSGFFGDAGVIGRDSGIGSVTQNGGSFVFNMANQGYLFVGASSSATTHAEYYMNGGSLDMNNNTLAVALSANGSTLITGLVNQVSGTINNVGKLDLGAFTFGPGRGIYRLTGGSIYIGANGIVSDSGVYEIYLGGGTVGAYAGWASSLNMNLTGINGPVTFDTAGNTINLTGILSGAGGFNVVGGGVLELGGANTFVGDMTVTAGTLQLDATGSSPGALHMVDTTTLNLNFSGNYIVGGFFTNGVQVANGTYNSGNMPGFITGSGNLVVQTVSLGIWDGGGADNAWSSVANWDHNVLPIFPIGLIFGGSTRLNNSNDLVSATATSITFSNDAGAFTLGGNSLNLGGAIGFTANPASPITQTINLPLTLTANVNVDTPANGNISIGGDITGVNNALLKIDSGTLTLGGNNNVAAFEADGGTNIIASTTTVTGTGGSRVYVANGDYIGGSLATMIIPNGATFSIGGNFADAFVVGRDTGVGRLIQNGGTFSFNMGNQNWIFVGAGNNPSTSGQYDMNGGVLDMNGKNLGLGLGAGAAVTGIVNQVSGVITNVGQLFLNPIFNGGYGFYNLTGGSIYIGSGGIAKNSGGGYQLNFGGGTVGAESSWSSSLNITLTGINGAATFDTAGNAIALSGVLSGPGGLITSGTGSLELSGVNTYTGDTTVGAGSTLKLDSTNNASSTFRASSGATLNLNYSGTITLASFYTNSVAIGNGVYTAGNLPSYITGAGSLTVVGSLPNTPPYLTNSVSGGNLQLSWPANYLGYILQYQVNPTSVGLSNNWVDISASASMTSTNIPITQTNPAVFYRLRHP